MYIVKDKLQQKKTRNFTLCNAMQSRSLCTSLRVRWRYSRVTFAGLGFQPLSLVAYQLGVLFFVAFLMVK